MEGSLRILREMIEEDDLSVLRIIKHTNYPTQVACLAQTKQWVSLLGCDTIYHREQLVHGFE